MNSSFAQAGQKTCEIPTQSDLSYFFDGNTSWTEVESGASMNIATRNPIFLTLNFARPANTRAEWGNKTMGGGNMQICHGENRNHIIVRQGVRQLQFYRLGRGLVRSYNALTGNYFYRPNNVVVRTERTSELHVTGTDESPAATM